MRPAAILGALVLAACTPPPPAKTAAPKKYEAPDERFVLFAPTKIDLSTDAFFSLGYVAAQLDAEPALHVLVVGHADPHGQTDAIREMSWRRARAVRKVLLDHGIKEARVHVAAPRELSGASADMLSRRVDLFVYDPAQENVEKRVGYPIEIKSE